jgi:hypothetical protein
MLGLPREGLQHCSVSLWQIDVVAELADERVHQEGTRIRTFIGGL